MFFLLCWLDMLSGMEIWISWSPSKALLKKEFQKFCYAQLQMAVDILSLVLSKERIFLAGGQIDCHTHLSMKIHHRLPCQSLAINGNERFVWVFETLLSLLSKVGSTFAELPMGI